MLMLATMVMGVVAHDEEHDDDDDNGEDGNDEYDDCGR